MTYQKPTLNYGTADADDESSLLFLGVADEAGVANKKKNGVLTLAVVAICFLFFTLGVIYQGSSNSLGFSGAFLLRSEPEPACMPVYDPKKDYCFKDNVKSDHYCWWPLDDFPEGDWKGVNAPSGANSGCGTPCTQFAEAYCVTSIDIEFTFSSLCTEYCSQDYAGCFKSLSALVNSD